MSEPHEQHQSHVLDDVEVRLNAAVLGALAGHKDLSPTEHRIIMCAVHHLLPHSSVAHLTREEIANQVQAGVAFVSRATTKLKKLGLLWRLDANRIQVNPHFAYRGDSREEWEQAIRDLPDAPPIRIPTTAAGKHAPHERKKPHLRLVT